MDYEVDKKSITFKIIGDFNLVKVNKIKEILKDKNTFELINFDLSNTLFVNSEAIKLIYFLNKEGKRLHLIKAPEIFKKTIKILSLEQAFTSIINKPL